MSAMEIAAKELEWMIGVSNANMRLIPGPVYNVKGYGAEGDGKTDDTLAIQAAVDACGEGGGGTVYFPPGEYVSGLVIIKHSNVYLVGSGVISTKVIMKPLNDSALFQFGHYSDTSVRGKLHHMGISDMEIDGNKSNQYQGSDPEDGSAIGVRVEDVTHVSIRRIKVHHCDGYGIGIVGTGLPNRSDLIVEDVETHNNNYDGIDIKAGFENVWIQRLKSYSNGPGIIPNRESHGIHVRGENIYVAECMTFDNANHGISIGELYALKRIDVVNLKSFGNNFDGVSVAGSDEGQYVFTSCYVDGNLRNGIGIDRGQTHLNNCIINNNDTFGISMKTDATGSLFVNGGSVSYNGQDGISSNNNNVLSINGAIIKQNGRRGISVQGSTKLNVIGSMIEGNGVADRSQGFGVVLIDMSNIWNITGCRIYDEEADTGNKNQRRGLQFSGSNIEGILTSNMMLDNWESAIGGNIPEDIVDANNLT